MAGTGSGAGTITGYGGTVINGPTTFADVDIDGGLGIDSGDDSNTNCVLGSTIGGGVTIENGDTDHRTDNDLVGVTGQYNYRQRT